MKLIDLGSIIHITYLLEFQGILPVYDTVISHIQGFLTCSRQHGKLMLLQRKTSKWLEMLGQKLVAFCSFRIAVRPGSTHVTVLERKMKN